MRPSLEEKIKRNKKQVQREKCILCEMFADTPVGSLLSGRFSQTPNTTPVPWSGILIS